MRSTKFGSHRLHFRWRHLVAQNESVTKNHRSEQKRLLQTDRVNVSPFGQQTLSFQTLFDSSLPETELIKEFQETLMATMKTKLNLPKDDIEALVHDSSDWDSTNVADLAKLLSDNLHTCIRDAIKKIIESGYTREVAEYTILQCGPFYAMKDMVSSIVERALNCLKSKGFHDATLHTFQDFNSLVEYMMLEMVTFLREIKPALSVHEAIWTLLMCDLNVLQAMEAEIDPQNISTGGVKVIQEEGTSPKAKPEPQPSTKRVTNRQKSFQAEKSYKGQTSKFVIKARPGMGGDFSFSLPLKETQQKAKPTILKVETVSSVPPKTADWYLAGIPYDETKGEHVPKDEKDEMIMYAVRQLNSLEKEVKSWDHWANVKVMQVAKKLSQDRLELNKLKADKVEAEKIRKDKQSMEEGVTRRFSEKMVALNTSNSQMSLAIVRLESENSLIKSEKEVAENQSFIEARRLDEALCKEREALKNSESFTSEKKFLEEELKSLKRKADPKLRDLEKAKCHVKETEARLAKERIETAKFLDQVENLRNERQRLEALAKEENERASAKAETNFLKFETVIKRIQYEIAARKLESEAKEIAAMRGMNWQNSEGTSTSGVHRDEFKHGTMSRKKDRECVMCLTEEMSVVFVPCGHQVVCAECNLIHEQSGMKDCPSCRTPIQKRITARFAKS